MSLSPESYLTNRNNILKALHLGFSLLLPFWPILSPVFISQGFRVTYSLSHWCFSFLSDLWKPIHDLNPFIFSVLSHLFFLYTSPLRPLHSTRSIFPAAIISSSKSADWNIYWTFQNLNLTSSSLADIYHYFVWQEPPGEHPLCHFMLLMCPPQVIPVHPAILEDFLLDPYGHPVARSLNCLGLWDLFRVRKVLNRFLGCRAHCGCHAFFVRYLVHRKISRAFVPVCCSLVHPRSFHADFGAWLAYKSATLLWYVNATYMRPQLDMWRICEWNISPVWFRWMGRLAVGPHRLKWHAETRSQAKTTEIPASDWTRTSKEKMSWSVLDSG